MKKTPAKKKPVRKLVKRIPARKASVRRKTRETSVEITVNLAGGRVVAETGMPFMDHMLDQIGRHAGIGLRVSALGDLEVDEHHTVEDCGLAFGEALAEALGDKAGIARFGDACAPLDESLARAVVDLSGRPGLVYNADFSRERIGGIDADLFREFFQALANSARMTVHLDLIRGVNAHHQVESLFKAFALALKRATAADPRSQGVPSTKGRL